MTDWEPLESRSADVEARLPALPRCQDPDCCASRRLWRRLRWRNGGIRLHGAWYCGPQCFESAACLHLSRVVRDVPTDEPVHHRIPLGLLLLSRGEVTNAQLRSALEAQRSSGRERIGHWLEQLGFVTASQVTAALGLQWACPVLPAARLEADCAGLIPYRLLERFRMVPVRLVAARKALYVAFSDGVHYPALYAIEQMLGYRTEACLIPGAVLETLLAQLDGQKGDQNFVFDGPSHAADMARITTGYALKLGVTGVRISVLSGYVWVRMEAERAIANLLFSHPLSAAPGLSLSHPSPRTLSARAGS